MKVGKTICGFLALTLNTSLHAAPAPVPDDLSPVPVYIAVESDSGQVLAARQPDLRFVPASLVKVMTAYVAFERIAAGRLDPSQRFVVSPSAYARWHGKGTTLYLRTGDVVPVDALLRGITTVSANDGAAVLAEGAAGSAEGWAALMNWHARSIGMANSRFATPNGWPDGGATFVTARDLATLGRALTDRHPALYARYFGQKSFTWNGVRQVNRDPAIGVVAGADGIKTGFTREAGYGYLGSARRGGRRVIVVVAGARSEAARSAAARALLDWSFAAWRHVPAFSAADTVAHARVQDGATASVPLRLDRPLGVSLPQDQAGRVRLTLSYRGPLRAPLAAGRHVADLIVAAPGSPPFRVPLITAEAVPVAGVFDRLRNGLTGLFR